MEYSEVWELQSTPHFRRRLKQYQKSRRNEVRNALANLNTYYGCLCEGTNPLQTPRFGFMHNEKHGAYAADQKGEGGKLAQIRLHFYPDVASRKLWLLTIGDKGTQGRDIQDCRDMVRDIPTQQSE